MGLFDKLFGPKPPKFASPEELRDALLEAAASNHPKRLEELCSAHRIEIQDHCESWTKPPESIRQDPSALQQYVNALIAVAVGLANRGEPKLLEKLTGGGPEGNPLKLWEGVMTQAQSLMGEGDYDQAHTLLENQLIDSRELIGTGADRYRSITTGMISQCKFHRGDVKPSLAPAQTALQMCEKAGDLEGIDAYLQTLLEIRRYLGQAAEAALLVDRLAALSAERKQPEIARAWTRRAALLRAGEPLCRIVVVIEGRRYEEDEAPSVRDNRVSFEFERNRISLGRSNALVRRGREAGSQDRPEEALALFREAARADAFNPDPHYQAGVALMILGRTADAAEEFRATEERAPGWFQCRSDLWLAERIVLGQFPQEVHLVLRALEDAPGTPQEKLALAEQALSKWATLAPLHLQQGIALGASGRQEDAVAAFRRGLEAAQEPDVRTRLLVHLAGVLPEGGQRTSLLKEAVGLRGNRVSAATAAYILRCGA